MTDSVILLRLFVEFCGLVVLQGFADLRTNFHPEPEAQSLNHPDIDLLGRFPLTVFQCRTAGADVVFPQGLIQCVGIRSAIDGLHQQRPHAVIFPDDGFTLWRGLQLVVPEPAQQVQLAAVIPGVQCTTGGRCDKAATVVSLVVGRCAFVAVSLLIGGSLFFFFFCICLISTHAGKAAGMGS